jgi:hypothetical protein
VLRFFVLPPQPPCFASLKLRESEEGGLKTKLDFKPPLGGLGAKKGEQDKKN